MVLLEQPWEKFFITDPFAYCPCSRHPPIPRKYPYHPPTDGTPCRPQFPDIGEWFLYNASYPGHRAQSEDPKATDSQYRPHHSCSLPWESPAQPSSHTAEVSYKGCWAHRALALSLPGGRSSSLNVLITHTQCICPILLWTICAAFWGMPNCIICSFV